MLRRLSAPCAGSRRPAAHRLSADRTCTRRTRATDRQHIQQALCMSCIGQRLRDAMRARDAQLRQTAIPEVARVHWMQWRFGEAGGQVWSGSRKPHPTSAHRTCTLWHMCDRLTASGRPPVPSTRTGSGGAQGPVAGRSRRGVFQTSNVSGGARTATIPGHRSGRSTDRPGWRGSWRGYPRRTSRRSRVRQ